MEIITERFSRGTESTLSRLVVNGFEVGYVLEDEDKGLRSSMPLTQIKNIKEYGRTAIPTGKYEVGLTVSTKFGGKLWPELLNVPGYGGIRPHAGNYVTDTYGCQLIGSSKPAPTKDKNGFWRVWDSRTAWGKLKPQIEAALYKGERVTWVIDNIDLH